MNAMERRIQQLEARRRADATPTLTRAAFDALTPAGRVRALQQRIRGNVRMAGTRRPRDPELPSLAEVRMMSEGEKAAAYRGWRERRGCR